MENKKIRHIGIIADGNRRWAKRNHLPQKAGYVYGLAAIEYLCEYSITREIKNLSIFCLSTENFSRTEEELDNFFKLARFYFKQKMDWYRKKNIKVVFCGNKKRFPSDIIELLQQTEKATVSGTALTLFIMVDYGGKQDIVQAITEGARTEEEITNYFEKRSPNPELIIRTGGNRRLSNFMLWQAAYSELYFIDTLFPDLNEQELDKILLDYNQVKCNYGK